MESMRQNMGTLNISAAIMSESIRLNDLASEGKKPTAEDEELEVLDIKDFREAFAEYGDEFLSEEIVKRVLQELEPHFKPEHFKEGTKILLAAFPCGSNGDLYTDEEMKEGKYFTTMYINKETNLNTGFDVLEPSTHALMLPDVIRKDCSFELHYDPNSSLSKFEQFKKQYIAAYHKLRELLTQES